RLQDAGFDATFSSLPWWDEHGSWFVEENELLRHVGAVIACPEPPFEIRLARRLSPETDVRAFYRHRLLIAAAVGHGLLIPMGFEFAAAQAMDPRLATPAEWTGAYGATDIDISADIRAANDVAAKLATLAIRGETRTLASPASSVTGLLRCDA